MVGVISRVVRRYLASIPIRVVVDLPKTLAARKKYPMFTDMVVGRFDQTVRMYRIFDASELKRILATGKITGGQYAVKAERDHGASWGHNINEVISWGISHSKAGRIGGDLYLAKMDAFDKYFAHLDPNLKVDLDGPDEQEMTMDADRCYTGLGCSIIDVDVRDCEFYSVDPKTEQIERIRLSELKHAV